MASSNINMSPLYLYTDLKTAAALTTLYQIIRPASERQTNIEHTQTLECLFTLQIARKFFQGDLR